MKVFSFLLLLVVAARAQNIECTRIQVFPSSLCENLKATLDFSNCSPAPVVRQTRMECQSEFLAEFIMEADDLVYRSILTKNADGSWSVGTPSRLAVVKPTMRSALTTDVSSTTPTKFWGEFKVRAENDKETNLASRLSPTLLRVRPGVEWYAQPRLALVAEVQAIKYYGSDEFVSSTATANARAKTSGNLQDTQLSFHQGYIKYMPNESTTLKLGRSTLMYGDGLLVGRNDWNIVGRSFDLALGRWSFALGWAEGFTSKLVDRSTVADRPGNEDLHGLYLHFDFGWGLSNVDPYIFSYQDSTNLDASGTALTSRMYEIWSYGLRAKSNIENWDYRAEGTKQTTAVTAFQVNTEVGYNLESFLKTRLAVEYFDADEDFNSLFGDTHRLLGLADIFARRNIQGQALHGRLDPLEAWTVSASYYWFRRHSETKAAYQSTGTALGTASIAKEMGEELDLEITYRLEKELQLQLGYADFKMSGYLSDQYRNIDPVKWYAQVTAKF